MSAHAQPIPAPRTLARKAEAAGDLLLAAAATGNAVLANSLSAEDMVLTDLIVRAGLPIRIITLDTGMLPKESLALIADANARFGVTVEVFRPDPAAVTAVMAGYGGTHGFYESLAARKACCGVRKIAPLEQALTGATAWITGMRRDQADSRAELHEVETDSARGIAKFNPLAGWSWDDVLTYAAAWDIPMNALYQRGYVSIGCDTCTRAIRPGEHPRMGRWWWEADAGSKECGLHVAR